MSSNIAPSVGSVEESSASANAGIPFQQLWWGLFLFLYLPIVYWFGWLLPPTVGIDYPSYFHAAQLAFAKGVTPYGLSAFNGIPGHAGGIVQPYFHPPPTLLLLWPLAKLSPPHARFAFILVSHLCFLGSIWLILAKLIPLSRDPLRREITLGFSLVYIMVFNAVITTFLNGQINFVALFFICLALAALKGNASPWRIALPLSLAILLKTYPVLLLLLLLARRQFRAIGYTCGMIAFFAAVATFVLPPHTWSTWFTTVTTLGEGYATTKIPVAIWWNQNINAFVVRLLEENVSSKAPLLYPFLAKPVTLGLVSLVAGVTVFFSFRAWQQAHREKSADDDLAAFLLMMYLVAPVSLDHHLVFVLPAAALAISLLTDGSVRGKLFVVIAAALLLLAWAFPFDQPDIRQGWWTLLISAKVYAAVVLWLFFIYRLRRLGSALLLDQSSKSPSATSAA